jgi:hypothetical protein
MGRQENCELLATKTIVPDTARPLYSHCAIIEAPSDLPDGEYEVEFAGEVASTMRQRGCWTVGQTLPHSHSELAALMVAGNVPVGRPLNRSTQHERQAHGEDSQQPQNQT